MLEPTSGRVTIQGMDNQIQIEEVRRYLGFCPQYGMMNNFFIFQILFCVLILDILYDELSVEEHLELIAKVSS
jgi:ABC-type multidrug transport system ATPase subunit